MKRSINTQEFERYWKLVHKQQELESYNVKLKGNKVVKTRQKIQLIEVNERYQTKAATETDPSGNITMHSTKLKARSLSE